ncbi:MAG: HD domain-containing protein [bacterium]|nr:HD domain-containing protein [bacterium]
MKPVDFFQIIHKYIPINTQSYHNYIIHVTLVAAYAIKIAKRFGLSKDQIQFIIEASMLHDIGICKVVDYKQELGGTLPYICHISEGAKILRLEGLEKHALVAERHTGLGIFKEEIIEKNLPLELKDYVPLTIEEEIISFADMFYKKDTARVWHRQTDEEVRNEISQFGEKHAKLLEEKFKKFNII